MNNNSDIIDVIMKDTTLVLSDNLIQLLNAKIGDRIEIGYKELHDKLLPIINIGDNGNKLNGSNSISFRGHQREVLTQFGSNFWAEKNGDFIYLNGDGVSVFTSVKKAIETYITKEIIEDRNYNIDKIKTYEF